MHFTFDLINRVQQAVKWPYQQPVCRTIWNGVMCDKRREITLHHNIRYHLGQSEDWIFCVTLVTRTRNVWRNVLSHICQSIDVISSVLSIRYWQCFHWLLISYKSWAEKHTQFWPKTICLRLLHERKILGICLKFRCRKLQAHEHK